MDLYVKDPSRATLKNAKLSRQRESSRSIKIYVALSITRNSREIACSAELLDDDSGCVLEGLGH